MQNLPVTSKMIDCVYFSQEDGQLYIQFHNGESRRFTGVPETEAVALTTAPSPGTHYIERIRTQFRRIAA